MSSTFRSPSGRSYSMRTSGKCTWPSITGRSRLAAHSAICGGVAVGVLFLPAALAFQILEEPLIVPLELVVEDHAVTTAPFSLRRSADPFVRAVEMGVVRQFSWFHEAGVVRLRSASRSGCRWLPTGLATAFRQRDEGRAVSSDDIGSRLHEPRFSKTSQFAVAGVCGTSPLVSEIGGHDDTEGTRCRQHPDL